MLVKELLDILPSNQACKLVYIVGDEIEEVKGKASYILNEYPYLMNYEIVTAYSNNSTLNICL